MYKDDEKLELSIMKFVLCSDPFDYIGWTKGLFPLMHHLPAAFKHYMAVPMVKVLLEAYVDGNGQEGFDLNFWIHDRYSMNFEYHEEAIETLNILYKPGVMKIFIYRGIPGPVTQDSPFWTKNS